VLMMSREWHHPSYRELERVLGVLRKHCPSLVSHCLGYYLSEYRLTTKPKLSEKKRTLRHADGSIVTEPCRERIVPSWVSPLKVDLAVVAIEAEFEGDPSLPEAFIAA
jgi:hypothetical protein